MTAAPLTPITVTSPAISIRQQIEDSFHSASAQLARLRSTERRFGTTQTTLTGLSGLVSGIAAATGLAAMSEWRAVCAAAAVLAFGATATGAAQKGRSDPDLLDHVSECVGKLRSLRVDALDGASDEAALRDRYREILTEYDRAEC